MTSANKQQKKQPQQQPQQPQAQQPEAQAAAQQPLSVREQFLASAKKYKLQVELKTEHGAEYVEKLRQNSITFGVGDAGTGKTFLAVAVAVLELMEGKVDKIIVGRPAVEATERLGFLKGSAEQKIAPYMVPIYDALDVLFNGNVPRNVMDSIEIAPLGFLRGRTFRSAFVLLDESQNSTLEQMKMLLTRPGEGTKYAITGDPTQVDLDKTTAGSGLVDAMRILKGKEGIAVQTFDKTDVVRSKLAQIVVDAFEEEAKRRQSQPKTLREVFHAFSWRTWFTGLLHREKPQAAAPGGNVVPFPAPGTQNTQQNQPSKPVMSTTAKLGG
jgi:phosphate starvation-inducible PhoH-like protein